MARLILITRDVEKAIAGGVANFAAALGYSLSGWRERKQVRTVAVDDEGFVWVRERQLPPNLREKARGLIDVNYKNTD